MRVMIAFFVLPWAGVIDARAQTPPGLQWDQSFGGSNADGLQSLRQTSDGGYILAGHSASRVSDNKASPSFGSYDYWVVKLEANGIKQWDRAFGGNSFDVLNSIDLTSDGGYILGGWSTSGASGSKSSVLHGGYDYWVVKVDANGNQQWDRSFGGSAFDFLYSLQQTSDGGYILGGFSGSGVSGNKTNSSLGGYDYWVIKLDASGSRQWEKSLGGSGDDVLSNLQQTREGGYILGGYSNSSVSGNKTNASFGGQDYWVVKLDASGNKQWDQSFGGVGDDFLSSLRQTGDDGYILGGYSLSGVSGNKTSPAFGEEDYWIVKLDASGNPQWDKSFGGSKRDVFSSLQPTSDNGYLLGGNSVSPVSGNKTSARLGGQDYWVVQVDANGNLQWDQSFGGSSTEGLSSLQPTSDGGYLLGGFSESSVSGNKISAPLGDADFWVVKLGSPNPPIITAQPQSQAVVLGTNVALTVTAQATAPLFYQWQKGGNHLPGQTNSALTWNSFQATNEGTYAVVVRTADGSVRSASALVLLNLPLRFYAVAVAGNLLQADLVGQPGTNYIFQMSTDLINWTALLTNNSTNEFVSFSDTNAASFPPRFYRVQQQP